MGLRAAIIGCGDIHVVHRAALERLPEVDLVAVAEVEPSRRPSDVRAYADYRELLEQERPDVVHICTPHDQHVEPALAAISQGVHVVLEKPLAAHLPAAEHLVECMVEHQQPGVKVALCYQNRYNLSYAKAKELIDSGRLGEVYGSVAAVPWKRTRDYYQSRPWRGSWRQSGGGVLINQAIHTIDALSWFFGGIETVSGMATRTEFADLIEVEDTAFARFTHPNGQVSQFFATVTGPVQAPVSIDIFAEHANLHIQDGLLVQWKGRPEEYYPERQLGGEGRDYWGVSHELLIADFYRQLDQPEPFWLGPAQGIEALQVIKQIQAQSPEWAALVQVEG